MQYSHSVALPVDFPVSIRVSDKLNRILRGMAKKEEISISQLCRRLLWLGLEHRNGEKRNANGVR
jgi:hypothetical protein